MNGQSHRANLSAKVQESGGQTYSKSTKKDDNFLRLQRSSALRSVQSSGRGGGFAGTRARVPQALPRQAMWFLSGQTANLPVVGHQTRERLQKLVTMYPRTLAPSLVHWIPLLTLTRISTRRTISRATCKGEGAKEVSHNPSILWIKINTTRRYQSSRTTSQNQTRSFCVS